MGRSVLMKLILVCAHGLTRPVQNNTFAHLLLARRFSAKFKSEIDKNRENLTFLDNLANKS